MMKTGRPLILAALLAALAALSACSPETRYEVLDFFFDGVPAPGQQPKVWIKNKRPKPTEIPRLHGPYAAKMCSACHEQTGSNRLILPVEKLCLNCHDLNLKTRRVHGPVASGGCRVCHDPHGSGKPYLLVAEPSKFCFYCHDEAEVRSHDVHRAIRTQCTECHNPHGSDSDYLLK